jgi:hypothetical protein
MYGNIEFVSDPETLWRKIESKWDWLGVKPDGTFVVGYPRRRGGLTGGGDLSVIGPDAREGDHGVRVRQPRGTSGGASWYPTEADAQAEFRKTVERERAIDAPGLVRIQRIENEAVVEEEFVVRKPTTYR